MTLETADTARRDSRMDRAPTEASIARRATGAEDVCQVRLIDQDTVGRAEDAMPASATVGVLAETIRILGDPTRLRMVRALRQPRLVRYRRVGEVPYYSLDDDHVRQLVDTGFIHADEHTDDSAR
jgi:ArsR family transcriptional regulator